MSADLSPSAGRTAEQDAAYGYSLVLLSSVAFAGQNAFAVMSYGGGATPLSLITVRMIVTLCVLALLMRLSGIRFALSRGDRNAALMLGVLNGAMAFCLMSAFHHIAVGLAILVFYLYPVLTGLAAWVLRQERMSRGLAVGLVGSFAGLALALDTDGAEANPLGLGLAFGASVLMAAIAIIAAKILRTGNTRSATVHMHISAVIVFAGASFIAGELPLPTTQPGWIGFGGVLFCYMIAITTFFAGMWRVGAVRSSLVMNLEPVVTIALGYVLLGQQLTAEQLSGAALVIASVTAVKWIRPGTRQA